MLLNKEGIIILSLSIYKEKCMSGGTQNHNSHNPGECPNQLDHQHFLSLEDLSKDLLLVRLEDHDLVQLPWETSYPS